MEPYTDEENFQANNSNYNNGKRKRMESTTVVPAENAFMHPNGDSSHSNSYLSPAVTIANNITNSRWKIDFNETFNPFRRFNSRSEITNEIYLLSLTQDRVAINDRNHKGGSCVVLRCISSKHSNSCPFYCKIRKSPRDDLWYICSGLNSQHICIPFKVTVKKLYKLLLYRKEYMAKAAFQLISHMNITPDADALVPSEDEGLETELHSTDHNQVNPIINTVMSVVEQELRSEQANNVHATAQIDYVNDNIPNINSRDLNVNLNTHNNSLITDNRSNNHYDYGMNLNSTMNSHINTNTHNNSASIPGNMNMNNYSSITGTATATATTATTGSNNNSDNNYPTTYDINNPHNNNHTEYLIPDSIYPSSSHIQQNHLNVSSPPPSAAAATAATMIDMNVSSHGHIHGGNINGIMSTGNMLYAPDSSNSMGSRYNNNIHNHININNSNNIPTYPFPLLQTDMHTLISEGDHDITGIDIDQKYMKAYAIRGKNTYKCSTCGSNAHTRPTCPLNMNYTGGNMFYHPTRTSRPLASMGNLTHNVSWIPSMPINYEVNSMGMSSPCSPPPPLMYNTHAYPVITSVNNIIPKHGSFNINSTHPNIGNGMENGMGLSVGMSMGVPGYNDPVPMMSLIHSNINTNSTNSSIGTSIHNIHTVHMTNTYV